MVHIDSIDEVQNNVTDEWFQFQIADLLEVLKQWKLKYGKVYRLWSFNTCILVVQDAEYIESILSSPRLLQKAFFYDQLSVWLGDGLLLSKGTKWQKRRKIFIPTFNIKILEQFVKIFDQQSQVMVDNLRDRANGETTIDIVNVACSTSLNILLETAMGVKISAQSADGIAYIKALKSLTHIVGARFLKPLQYLDFTFKLLSFKAYRTLQKNVQILHGFTEKVINERRNELMKSIADGNENERDIRKRMTFLDVLLQATIDGQPLTNEDIREEVDTFTLGGHDTITYATSFTLYLISRHPEVQQKAFDEVLKVIGPDKNKPVSMRELQELKYLECVIKESLRLYPPGPAIGRITVEDHKMGDKIIPSNTNIVLLTYAVGRDPDYFSRPNDFLPERFASVNGEKINPYTFLPFSAGPRNCMGQKFAMLEMKSIVSCILRHYELLPLGPDVVRIISMVMNSATGINIGLKLRES
ncbi:probable cytochrome P450 4d14 [Calliphora vicina]|uniref:probable cytochrome P450 4d14 n=1 Tax=Calliphora vicina TaxID=7373 RepID=UPI00325A70F4